MRAFELYILSIDLLVVNSQKERSPEVEQEEKEIPHEKGVDE